MEMKAAVVDTHDDTVDSLITSHAASSTAASASTLSRTAPLVTSSISVTIGQVSANSETKVTERQYSVSAVGDGPQISTAGDGSVVLILSYSPLTLDTNDDNATADTAVISRTSDRLSESEAQSSAADADNVTKNSVTQRFVVGLFLCCLVSFQFICLLLFYFMNNKSSSLLKY